MNIFWYEVIVELFFGSLHNWTILGGSFLYM